MSIRGDLQERFYQTIKDLGFNAPYGVLLGQESSGVKARTVTFGRPRTLDATLRIFGPTFIQIKTSRGVSQAFTGKSAVADAEAFLKTI